ncbi:hypothetical protein JKY79_03295 [Candidatus Babeliales bacterium]|nr:hypothetical protein [Candidatus Babeliales bacterium]
MKYFFLLIWFFCREKNGSSQGPKLSQHSFFSSFLITMVIVIQIEINRGLI